MRFLNSPTSAESVFDLDEGLPEVGASSSEDGLVCRPFLPDILDFLEVSFRLERPVKVLSRLCSQAEVILVVFRDLRISGFTDDSSIIDTEEIERCFWIPTMRLTGSEKVFEVLGRV